MLAIRDIFHGSVRALMVLVFASSAMHKLLNAGALLEFLDAIGMTSAPLRHAMWGAIVGVEVFLACAVIVGWRQRRGLGLALGWLVLATALLVAKRAELSAYAGCPCLPAIGGLQATTVGGAILRNLVLCGVAWVGMATAFAGGVAAPEKTSTDL